MSRISKIFCLSNIILIIAVIVVFFVGKEYGERKTEKVEPQEVIITDILAEHHLRSLQSKTDWQDPVTKIKQDLISKPELIPEEPVLGGEMGFYSEENIHLLTDKLAIAYFEDGHIGGYAVLSYDLSDPNEISWQVVHSYLK